LNPESLIHVELAEWQTLGPDNCQALAGMRLDDSPGVRAVVERLTQRNLLGITELRQGLRIEAFSHVGRLRIGGLNLTIRPKITGSSLLNLVRYAFGLRRLHLLTDDSPLVNQLGLEDLLISQLNAEVHELVSRGLLRAYVPTGERLSSPRGRIDIRKLATEGGTPAATLPCLHHPRIEDTSLNRVLLAGLKMAASMAGSVELRRESRKVAALMDERVSPMRLDLDGLCRIQRGMNRLNAAYEPSMTIIRMLFESQGIAFGGASAHVALPGFLFDMNAFFQALTSRFLRENLPEYVVRDEHGLKGMMRYRPDFNPRSRQSPTPRPDFVIERKGKIVAFLDAKYRDLWEKPLPRDMLYQLAVYAMSHHELRSSVILYPATSHAATEARIDIADPNFGNHLAQVRLRPVHLPTLEKLVANHTAKGQRGRESYAWDLAFCHG